MGEHESSTTTFDAHAFVGGRETPKQFVEVFSSATDASDLAVVDVVIPAFAFGHENPTDVGILRDSSLGRGVQQIRDEAIPIGIAVERFSLGERLAEVDPEMARGLGALPVVVGRTARGVDFVNTVSAVFPQTLKILEYLAPFVHVAPPRPRRRRRTHFFFACFVLRGARVRFDFFSRETKA